MSYIVVIHHMYYLQVGLASPENETTRSLKEAFWDETKIANLLQFRILLPLPPGSVGQPQFRPAASVIVSESTCQQFEDALIEQ